MGKTIYADSVVQQTIAPQQSYWQQVGVGVSITLIAAVCLWVGRRFYKKVLSKYSFKVVKKDD